MPSFKVIIGCEYFVSAPTPEEAKNKARKEYFKDKSGIVRFSRNSSRL